MSQLLSISVNTIFENFFFYRCQQILFLFDNTKPGSTKQSLRVSKQASEFSYNCYLLIFRKLKISGDNDDNSRTIRTREGLTAKFHYYRINVADSRKELEPRVPLLSMSNHQTRSVQKKIKFLRSYGKVRVTWRI